MNSEKAQLSNEPKDRKRHINRLKAVGAVLSVVGIALFAYFVYSVGPRELIDGISRFGFVGFAVILSIYFVRIVTRAYAWKLSVHGPYELRLKDTIPAVVIGESVSSTIPLGILASGTSKAVAVRNRIPFVAGLSSVATENLFYSFVTGLFLIIGAALLLRGFAVDESIVYTINLLIGSLSILITLGVIMVIRQWHFASAICNWVYHHSLLTRLLENGRHEVRRFEELIYGFYRHYPRRFVPICLLQVSYHLLGVTEVWFILGRLSDGVPGLLTAFLLESVSRLVTILFKLVPFVIGVDEAGAQLVGDAVALAAGVGVTLAIIRKGRILFWTAIGWILIAKRGLRLSEIRSAID
ncbi:MAG: lysylphosphatidylglycerol synthase transmembrane domain-containing protein [Pyrinomonadaceae bacterium]